MGLATFETLIPINSVRAEHLALRKNDLTGDLINGGKITEFSSTGISDLSTNTILDITDDVVTISNTLHTANLTVDGELKVKNLIYEFTQDEVATDIFLNRDNVVRIGNNDVLTKDSLGKCIFYSNLKKLGNLRSLEVGETLLVNTTQQSVGINTSKAFGALHVNSKTGAELIIDGNGKDSYIGTVRGNDLYLGTNATAKAKVTQLIISNNGNVGIGVPNPEASLDISGDLKFDGVTFQTGTDEEIPDKHNMRGDIIWNKEPIQGKPIGWVCVQEGNPGNWHKFGLIN